MTGENNITAGQRADMLTVGDYFSRLRPVQADRRIAYGEGPSQWIDLFLPSRPGPCPLVVLIHGGCWGTVASADTVSANAAELAANGVITCSIEYRRVGEPGGGFPGMFMDVGRAVDHLRSIGPELGLDLTNVVVVGHSAGAHLALWLAARHRIPSDSVLYVPDPLRVRSVVAIAGPGDLRRHVALMGITCAGISTIDQVVGSPLTRPDPFADTSPRDLLPIGVRTVSITGHYDDNWPPYVSEQWCRAARAAGDDAEEILLPYCAHFDVIDVGTEAWRAVRDVILAEVRRTV